MIESELEKRLMAVSKAWAMNDDWNDYCQPDSNWPVLALSHSLGKSVDAEVAQLKNGRYLDFFKSHGLCECASSI